MTGSVIALWHNYKQYKHLFYYKPENFIEGKMSIVYKVTCDRCEKKYPAEIDTDMHFGSFFGALPDDAALEVKRNDWLITLENEVLCPACGTGDDSDIENEEEHEGEEKRLKESAYRLSNSKIFTGRTHADAWSKVPGTYGMLPYKSMSEEEAIKELIYDCEIHYHIDGNILSSAAEYYEFLFTEVKFHADCWGLSFEKAREVYSFWAHKYHSVEYD